MKQYTTPEQTAQLIELGFKPGTRIKGARVVHFKIEINNDFNFTIGELIEMLPEVLAPSNNDDWGMPLSISTDSFMWTVEYDGGYFSPYEAASNELIDALYYMVVELKAEGVI